MEIDEQLRVVKDTYSLDEGKLDVSDSLKLYIDSEFLLFEVTQHVTHRLLRFQIVLLRWAQARQEAP